MELVSVIVPAYNVEKYLEKCINSIINQTYSNLEIILIDDGSPDKCGIICDEYAKKDKRIKVIHQKNAGLSAARNTGIENANGKYISFVDSDDYLSNDYIETLYNLLVKTDSDVSAVNYLRVNEDDDNPIRNITAKNENVIIYENKDVVKEMLIKKTFQNIVWNKLYKREIIGNHRFPKGINYEDIYFSYEVLTEAKKIAYTNRECYFYLKRESSISRVSSEKNLLDFLYVVFYKYNGIKNRFPDLELYNCYAFYQSILAISLVYTKGDNKYESVESGVKKGIEIINEFITKNEIQFIDLLDDFEKAVIYLMRYNIDLYYSFLKEDRKIKQLNMC